MAVGAFSLGMGGTGFIATRKRPGHFVALSEDGRIDATLSPPASVSTWMPNGFRSL